MSGQCPAWNGVSRTVSIRDKLFAILKSLIILSILDGSGTFIWDSYWNGLYIYGHILRSNWLFPEQLATYLFYLNWHMLIQNIHQSAWAPCVTVLILPECTDSSYKATRTALSRTAPDMTILICSISPSVLALILSKWMNSLRNTAQTTLSEQLQTAL